MSKLSSSPATASAHLFQEDAAIVVREWGSFDATPDPGRHTLATKSKKRWVKKQVQRTRRQVLRVKNLVPTRIRRRVNHTLTHGPDADSGQQPTHRLGPAVQQKEEDRSRLESGVQRSIGAHPGRKGESEQGRAVCISKRSQESGLHSPESRGSLPTGPASLVWNGSSCLNDRSPCYHAIY